MISVLKRLGAFYVRNELWILKFIRNSSACALVLAVLAFQFGDGQVDEFDVSLWALSVGVMHGAILAERDRQVREDRS